MEFKCGTYKIKNTKDNRCYFGSSKNIDKRWQTHKQQLNTNKHHNIFLQRAWNKYGETSFEFIKIEELPESELLISEQILLDENLNSYNIGKNASGGDNLSNHPKRTEIIEKIKKGLVKRYENQTPEQKENYSIKLRGENNPNFGNKWNDEQRLALKNRRIGVKSSEETVKKISLNSIKMWAKEGFKEKQKENKTGEKNHFYGKKHSQETKEHLSKKQKENCKLLSLEEKLKRFPHMIMISIDGVLYNSLTEASKILNINRQTIGHRVKSKNFESYYKIKQQQEPSQQDHIDNHLN